MEYIYFKMGMHFWDEATSLLKWEVKGGSVWTELLYVRASDRLICKDLTVGFISRILYPLNNL